MLYGASLPIESTDFRIVGTWVFPYIEAAGGSDATATAQYPFYVASSLCFLSAALVFFCIPHIGQDTIQLEDERFRVYLESQVCTLFFPCSPSVIPTKLTL